MAAHSTVLPWKIPWIEEPGGLQSMRLQTVRHDLVTKHAQNGSKGRMTVIYVGTGFNDFKRILF